MTPEEEQAAFEEWLARHPEKLEEYFEHKWNTAMEKHKYASKTKTAKLGHHASNALNWGKNTFYIPPFKDDLLGTHSQKESQDDAKFDQMMRKAIANHQRKKLSDDTSITLDTDIP